MMVRKRIPHVRAKRGIIPSKDPAKDRARHVHTLFRKFKHRLANEDSRISMINLSKEILEIGESDALFAGKDPLVSGIAIFVYTCRRFSYENICPVTYDEIREEHANFSSGATFVQMLKTLSTRFGKIKFKDTTLRRKRFYRS